MGKVGLLAVLCVPMVAAGALVPLRLRGGWRVARDPRVWGRGSLENQGNSPTRAGEEGFAPRSFAHKITVEELRTIPGWELAQENKRQQQQSLIHREALHSALIMMPGDAPSVPDAVVLACARSTRSPPGSQESAAAAITGAATAVAPAVGEAQQLFVKPGAYAWRGLVPVGALPQSTHARLRFLARSHARMHTYHAYA